MQPKKTWRPVFTIVKNARGSYWLRVGIAFQNRDGSINIRLDALPVNGELQIRDESPKAAIGPGLEPSNE